MSGLGEFLRRVRMLLRGRQFDREMEEEMRLHAELRERDARAAGANAEEARFTAQRQMGNELLLREQSREAWGWSWLEHFVQDVVFGLRLMWKSPGFTVVAVLTLALGMGATTAIFSAANPILFEPLPYPNADRLTMIWDFGVDGSRLEVTYGTFRELAERNHSFAALAVMKPWQPTITGAAEPERLEGQSVGADFFRVLGVQPALGRSFDESDDRPNSPRVVILSETVWRRRFSEDRAIIGRDIVLDDDHYSVIGVMPRSFENVLSPSAELWTPLSYAMTQGRAWGHHLRMVGRLRPGVGIGPAGSELNQIAKTPVPEFSRPPWAALGQGLVVHSLQEDVTRSVKPALVAVFGAVLLVLVIACVNVTNLLLARGAQRRGEFAVRIALGAGRARILRQLMTESLLLAVLGGGLGLLVAEFGVGALLALSPPGLPRVNAIRLDGSAFAFGVAITTLMGLAVGLIPAWRAFRGSPLLGLQQSSRRTTTSQSWMRRALVVTEVALALVLLVSAGLLVRSFHRLFSIPAGFNPSHLLAMQVQTTGQRFDGGGTHRFFAQTLEAVRRVPGVTAAAFTSQLPLSGQYDEYGLALESNPDKSQGGVPVFRYATSPGYFEALGIPLRRGRLFDTHDSGSGAAVAVISESMARKIPAANPIGQRVHVGPLDSAPYTIVGVVGDVKQASLASDRVDAVYIPSEQWPFPDRAMWMVVRARGDAAALAPAIRQAIWSVDKDQPIVRVAQMEELLAASESERRFAMIIFQAFALAALVLATAGLYGVLMGSVVERTHEIGVRSALGASRANILALVLRQGMMLTGLGLAIGLVVSATATQVLRALLFGVSRLDATTHAAVIVLLLVVSGTACWIPAQRAARVDPMVALRDE